MLVLKIIIKDMCECEKANPPMEQATLPNAVQTYRGGGVHRRRHCNEF